MASSCGKKMKKMEAGGLAKGAKGAAMSVEKLKQLTKERNKAEGRRKQMAEMQKMKPKENKTAPQKQMSPMAGQKPLQKPNNPGLSKLPEEVRNKMGYMKKGGMAKKKMKSGGMVKRDGCAVRGKTKGRMV